MGDETRDLGFRRTERDVAIDAPAGSADRLLAGSQVVIPAEDNDGDLAVGANDAGRAQPKVGNPDDLAAGAAGLGAEQADLNQEVADISLSNNEILDGAADDKTGESVMDDVSGLTDSRADGLLASATQFDQFADFDNKGGLASHGRADHS